jgi:DNA-binding transcriptional ArsR family regulator
MSTVSTCDLRLGDLADDEPTTQTRKKPVHPAPGSPQVDGILQIRNSMEKARFGAVSGGVGRVAARQVRIPNCERTENLVCLGIVDRSAGRSSAVTLPSPDYDADDVLVVRDREQLRALAGPIRGDLVQRLRERARSTTELANELGLPKGTVAYHVRVLEQAGLIRTVRTRQVRAVTERYYGRVARLFILKGDEDRDEGSLEVRLTAHDARRFALRLERLLDDVRGSAIPDGEPFVLVARLERR